MLSQDLDELDGIVALFGETNAEESSVALGILHRQHVVAAAINRGHDRFISNGRLGNNFS